MKSLAVWKEVVESIGHPSGKELSMGCVEIEMSRKRESEGLGDAGLKSEETLGLEEGVSGSIRGHGHVSMRVCT